MDKRKLLKVVLMLVLLACGIGPIKGQAVAAGSRYFPETGKTVNDPFLTYWNTHGQLAQQGFPITDAVDEVNDADGKTYQTQYFERARFEYHPENTDPRFQVLLGLLGLEALKGKYGDNSNMVDNNKQVVPGNGSRKFPQTGKTVTGLFLQYWNAHGGLEQQGYPLTEAFEEVNAGDGKTYTVQYFERARFEYHPENTDVKYQVLLGFVGKEVYAGKHGNDTGGTGDTGGAGGTSGTGDTGGTGSTGDPGNTTPEVAPPDWKTVGATPPFDAAFLWPDTTPSIAYFVKGTGLYYYDIPTSTVREGYPVSLRNLQGSPYDVIDAAVAWTPGNIYYGRVFLIAGPTMVAYNIPLGRVDNALIDPYTGRILPAQPFPISYYLPGLKDNYYAGIDAAAIWPNDSPTPHKLYIFKGERVTRMDGTTNTVDTGFNDIPIKEAFPGFPFDNGVDNVLPWTNGKAYFFKGDQFASYDIASQTWDPGYARPIISNP